MVKIIATQNLPYGHRRYAAGEEFDASEKDAKLLVKIGRASHVHHTRHLEAPEPQIVEPPPPVAEITPKEAAPEAQPDPQTYRRRDMVAEAPAKAGPTGQAKPSPSSRRAPARKGKA
jgi:hypothetical protein